MSRQVLPFAFEDEFRRDDRQPSAADLQAEVARLRREVTEAREEGRRIGTAEALAALEEQREQAMLAATAALATALATLEQRFDRAETALSRLAAELALDLADHLAARAVERDPVLAIDQALARALREVRRGQPIEVRVAPELQEAVERCIAERQAGDRRRLNLVVRGDADVAAGNAVINWDGGALVLDRDARRAALEAEIAGLSAA